MKKFVCTVCGYVFEGETAPEFCPQCKAPREKFKEQGDGMTWAAEHVVGVAAGAPEDIMADLRAHFQGEGKPGDVARLAAQGARACKHQHGAHPLPAERKRIAYAFA